MVKIIGTSTVPRYITGLYSFDRAFHSTKLGFPASGVVELYGPTHVGKSTVAYSLSAILAMQKGCNISIFDNEGLDDEFLQNVINGQGYDGTVYLIQKELDEEALDTLIDYATGGENATIGIVDSAGSISPLAELEGNIGEANIRGRAYVLGQFVRKLGHANLGKHDKVIFLTNHIQANIGGIGVSTPGGKATTYGTVIKIQLKQKDGFPSSSDTSFGYLVEGTVRKNRWGGKGGQFQVCVLANYGVHHGLTALFDCVNLGLVDRKRTLKIGDENIGYLRSYFEGAKDGKTEPFEIFYDLLRDVSKEEKEDIEDEENNNRD